MDRARREHLITRGTTRRRLIAGGLASAVLSLSLPNRPTRVRARDALAVARPASGSSLFSLGVASGDPLPDSVVLWTRLAPDPLNGGGMGSDPVEVRWELAADDAMRRIVQRGSVTATPDLAHAVHVDMTGLAPGHEYFYRFATGSEVSPTGRTKTAPAAGAVVDRLRFAFASCAHWEHGYFSAYKDMAAQDLDVVFFVGDYIYEYGRNGAFRGDNGPVRLFAETSEITTLAAYRNRHAQYKTDPDLQAAHRAFPWIVTWDDHEVENDYAGTESAKHESTAVLLARRAAAYRAYYEHMPLRSASLPQGPDMRLYRRFSFGRLAEFSVLDTRQYRTPHPCGDKIGSRCPAAFDPAQTMTGPEQERWLLAGLAASPARWNVIAQQVMMAQLTANLGTGNQFNHDMWDGYPLARQRILGHIRDAGTKNVVVLAGDIHSAWASDLKADFADPSSRVVATEFVATSITTRNPVVQELPLLVPLNPHVKFLDTRHGYTRCDLTPGRWQADYRAVETVALPDTPARTVGSLVVEHGHPGPVRA